MNITHKRLIRHMPTYERRNALINEIFRVTAIELEGVQVSAEESYAELFIDTAIRALEIHERDLGLKKGLLNDKQRREMILARYRAALEQTTDAALKSICEVFSNGAVEINKTATVGIYEIKFTGTIGIPDNMQGLMSTIDMVLPAHLEVIYSYVYNTYADLSAFTYTQLAQYKYEDVRGEDLE